MKVSKHTPVCHESHTYNLIAGSDSLIVGSDTATIWNAPVCHESHTYNRIASTEAIRFMTDRCFWKIPNWVAPMGSKHLPGGAFNRSLTREALVVLWICCDHISSHHISSLVEALDMLWSYQQRLWICCDHISSLVLEVLWVMINKERDLMTPHAGFQTWCKVSSSNPWRVCRVTSHPGSHHHGHINDGLCRVWRAWTGRSVHHWHPPEHRDERDEEENDEGRLWQEYTHRPGQPREEEPRQE